MFAGIPKSEQFYERRVVPLAAAFDDMLQHSWKKGDILGGEWAVSGVGDGPQMHHLDDGRIQLIDVLFSLEVLVELLEVLAGYSLQLVQQMLSLGLQAVG
jgi:hypothetical protein